MSPALSLLAFAPEAAPPGTVLPVTDAGSRLLEQGLLGALLVLALVAIAWLAKSLHGTMNQRVLDAQGYGVRLAELSAAGNAVLGELKLAVDGLQRECSENRHSVTKSLDDLADTVENLKDEQIRGLAPLSARGK